MSRPATALDENPFPGLRPFRDDEDHLFFGRESQVDSMVDKLAASRFLAVVGTSGSGKSSLVNCGLRPALHRGLMTGAGTSWRTVVFRPGSHPLRAMARALAEVLFKGFAPEGVAVDEIVEATLRMSKLGIADVYEQAQLDRGVNLLIVADQFEEVFRYRSLGSSSSAASDPVAEATAVVDLLLEAKAQRSLPIYVVLTMRSDFLGDCAQFSGLPEAINQGEYLVPRLTRDERRQAIAGPIGVGGGRISPVLLTRLVNDVGDNPDQLSILQHALNRTWARWNHQQSAGEAISLSHYEAIGTMANALDQHAEKAYAEHTTDRQRKICEILFKALTYKGADARGIRRPTRFAVLCALAEATPEELQEVIGIYRRPSRSFLMPPLPEPLEPDTIVDISHESLMRVWERLRTWVEEEAASAAQYMRLAQSTALHAKGEAGLMTDPELSILLEWRNTQRPNTAWAERYSAGFELATSFLDQSRDGRDVAVRAAENQQHRDSRRKRTVRLIVAIASLLVIVFAAVAVDQHLHKDELTQERDRLQQTILVMENALNAQADEIKATSALSFSRNHLSTLRQGTSQYSDALDKLNANEEIANGELLKAAEASAKAAAIIAGGTTMSFDDIRRQGLFAKSDVQVTSTSGANKPENMFDHTGPPGDSTALFFADQKPQGFRHTIEWRTQNAVRPGSIAVFAAHDKTDYGPRRAFSHFTLSAKIGGQWKVLKEFTPSLPYGGGQVDGYAKGTTLAVCLRVEQSAAQEFRAEFTQALDVLGNYSGPRVLGLDAFADSKCQAG